MDKFKLVCLHGNSQDKSVFDSFQVKNCEKITLNLPGHGGRPLGSVKGFPDLVDAVYEDIKGLDNVVLLGISLGGHVAHHLVKRVQPHAVFTIASPPLSDSTSVAKAFNPHPFLIYLFQKDVNEIQANELARSILGEKHPKLQDLVKMILSTSPEVRGIIGASLNRGEFENEIEILRSYRGKKVLIYPTQDNFINESYMKSVNVAPVKDMKGCHILPWDNAKQLQDFVSMVLFGE